MSFRPKSPHRGMNSHQLHEYMKQCQDSLDTMDPEEFLDWKVFGVLTLQYNVGPSRARQLFSRWLREIKKQAQPLCFNWFAVFANDPWNKDMRIHFLLGGRPFSYQARWSVRWQDLGGSEAAISEYRRGAFVRHVLKNAGIGQYFQIAMELYGLGLFEVNAE